MGEKRAALVTGGASGIGREIVKELLLSGFDVCTFDIDQNGLNSAAKEFAPSATKRTSPVASHLCWNVIKG